MPREKFIENFTNFLRSAYLGRVTKGRILCLTDTGHMGLMPERARPGDFVCLLLGGSSPYVLRPIVDQGAEQETARIAQRYELLENAMFTV